jgi:hypothetical protein
MDSFVIATDHVAVRARSDKTQLLFLILAPRPGKPVPIIAGIFV